MNSTEKQLADMLKELQSRSKAKVILELSSFTIILFFLFVGNFLTLLVLVRNRRMQTIPNMFVASLATTDFFLGALISCPLGLPTLATSRWIFSNATCQYKGYVAVTLVFASIHTLALMAVNRYFRIVKPAKYRRYFTKKKTIIMIALSWFYSMCAPLPYMLSGHQMVFHPSKCLCFLQIHSGAFTAFLDTVYIGIPSCVIFFCYVRIFKTVRSHNNNFQNTGDGTGTVNVEDIKVTCTLFVIVVFFGLCWVPVVLIDVVDTVHGSWTFPREVYLAYSFLATINSALNPMIYGALNKTLRKEYLKILRCRCGHSRGTVEPFIVELRARGKRIHP